MDSEILPKSERRSLRHDFTAVETVELSHQLAQKTKDLNALEEEKKSVTAQYGARVKEVKASCNKLSNQVADGFEIRDVDCDIAWHVPTQGWKTLAPRNGAAAIVEKMTQEEYTLFNQEPEADPDADGDGWVAKEDLDSGKVRAPKRGRKKRA